MTTLGTTTVPVSGEATFAPAPEELRVAVFSDALPERNGTGAYYHDLIGQLAPRVAEARVLHPRPREGRLRLSLPLPGDSSQRYVPPNLLRIRREMATLRPHIIVGVTPGPFGLLGARLARQHGCGFISAFHTHFEGLADLYWGPFGRRFAIHVLNRINHHLHRQSATVLVNNRDLDPVVRNLGAPAVDLMGTPLERCFLEAEQPPLPRQLARVGFAGRLAAEKNIDAILEAALRRPDLQFVIGGDGPLRPRVEEAAARLENLDYRGWLERADLLALMDTIDLLLLPSHQETFGSVALEAMARGRPALVSASAGIHDWPELAPALFTLHAGDDLATLLEDLREQPDALTAAAEAAHEAARRLNDRTIEHWLAVLTRHAREGRG
ncbi:MAG: glycosyltransferase [Pseudomonadota bacterium]